MAILVSAALALTVACGGSESQSEDGVTTITFSGASDETFMAAQLDLIERFEAAHPEINVEFEPAAGVDAEEGAILRLGQGDPSLDIVTTEVGYEYQWYTEGWIEPLTSYVTDEELAQIDQHLVDNETFDGEFLAVPVDNSTMYLAVNYDLLAEAGVEGPPSLQRNSFDEVVEGVWTWEQVVDAAAAVKEATGKTGLLIPNDETWILAPFGQQLGGETTNEDGLEVEGYLDGDQWVELATRYQSWFEDGVADITNPEWTTDQFLAGESAFQLAHIGDFDMCASASFECDAAAQPHFADGVPAVQSNGIALAMNAASEHKDEAAAFLKFILLDPEGQSALVDGNYFAAIPWQQASLDAITTDPAYAEFPLSVKRLGAYQFQNWPSRAIKTPAAATVFTVMSDAFLDVRVGAMSPEEAVGTMTERVERDLEAYRG
ncbi:ABC transporter substrate-binding protein [Jiangella asiatica]|uniref:ABC transporter substrate-binding protein n=1 Tax=Jiangella asiatica TaxID=2530372 RepID=UPI0013A5E16F|nr:extracellular solute-binding protein [Jiangella asiatica]